MTYIKNQKDYLDDLSEQMELLCDYCRQMDAGKLHYSKPLATLLRVLVHVTPSSKSLLSLMKKQHLMKFCSSSKSYPKTKDIIYLVTLITKAQKISVSSGQMTSTPIFVPNLSNTISPARWINFDNWYTNAVFIINKDSNDGLILLEQKPGSKLIISRKKIITYFSNKDGGAHVDNEVDEDMFHLSRSLSSIDYEDVKPQELYEPGERYVAGVPIQHSLHAALRQIAHEMILTISKEFGMQPSYNPLHKEILGYDIQPAHEICVRFNPNTRQVSTTY